MAGGLEDITPHIEFEGAREAGEALRELGVIGAEAFSKIIQAASGGNFTGLATMIGGELAGALTEATQKVLEFVSAQAELVETLSSLAEATGMTVPQIEGLKDAFASVGISTNGFERAIGRLAITIGNQWSQIQQSVRTSADSQEGAMQHIAQTALNVQKAYESLNQAFTHASQAAAKDALAVESAALSLLRAQDALTQAANEANKNTLSLESAQMALKRAQLNLAKDQGYDTKEAEKALKLDQDHLAVKEAEQRVVDAQHKKSQEGLELQERQLKLKQAEQAVSDAATKQIEDSINSTQKIRQAELDVAKAKLAQREAAEKAHEVDLKDIPAIAKEVEQVAEGHKKWDQVMNHAEISAQNLTKAVILAASAGKGEVPSTIAVFQELGKVIENMGHSADANSKKLELVQHTMGAGFRSGQASAAQLLAILERGPEALAKFQQEADKFSKTKIGLDTHAVEDLKAFNAAWAKLDGILEQVKGRFAAMVAPGLAAAMDAIRESITNTDGVLHKIIETVLQFMSAVGKLGSQIAGAVGDIIGIFTKMAETIARAFGITPTQLWAGALAALFAPINALIKAIELIAKAIQFVREHWAESLKAMQTAAEGVADWFASTFVGKIVKAIGEIIDKIKDWAAALGLVKKGHDDATKGHGAPNKEGSSEGAGTSPTGGGAAGTASSGLSSAASKLDASAEKMGQTFNKIDQSWGKRDESWGKRDDKWGKHSDASDGQGGAGDKLASSGDKLDEAGGSLMAAAQALSAAAAAQPQQTGAAAEGGMIHGPGGPTSDSAGLFALSDGEYVVRNAAVSHYGAGLFEALNNLSVGGFAMGGAVGASAPRLSGGAAGGPSSVLNLTIDGEHFNGLRAPENVASKLKTHAVMRQSSSAGRMPSWMR